MWNTRFTKTFSCRLPIMGAPMAGASGGRLAAETYRAGALGFIAAGHLRDVCQLDGEIALFRQTAPADAPLCIGFIGFSALEDSAGWDRYKRILEQHRPAVVQFFAPAIIDAPPNGQPNVSNNVALAQKYSAKVVAQVGSVCQGIEALDAGVDCLIAQGSEAGGHGLRRELGSGTLALAARLVSVAAESHPHVPVLAAGGIMDGRGVAAALALGCDGAVLGTRLWASQEATGHVAFKEGLVTAGSCDDVIRSTVFDHIQNVYTETPWPEPFDSVGALRNGTSDKWDGCPADLEKELLNEKSDVVSGYRLAQKEGNANVTAVLCGQGVGEIDSIDPAFDIITRINEEAMTVIRNMPRMLQESRKRAFSE
jgi:nitronate monooxygenase